MEFGGHLTYFERKTERPTGLGKKYKLPNGDNLMPSGISHMLLSRYLPLGADRPFLHKLRANTRYFKVGTIAPDLPCASLTSADRYDTFGLPEDQYKPNSWD